MSYAKVSLVGAGPGDLGLITDKGLNCIRRADAIVYDSLISPSILNEAKLSAELIYAGKRASRHHMKQKDISELLVKKAKEGKYTVRLKGGDPYIFGRGQEEVRELILEGIEYEIVSGVSSAYSVPAYAGISVTDRELSSSVHIITGREKSGKEGNTERYKNFAECEGTLVFLMGLGKLKEITEKLISYGKPAATPISVIFDGTRVSQRVIIGNLYNICEKLRKVYIEAPALIVIGKVVEHSRKYDWFIKAYKDKELFGKRILFTGSRQLIKSCKETFDESGADCIYMSLIETVREENELYISSIDNIEKYNWVIFTSPNGIKHFFEDIRSRSGLDIRRLFGLKFAVIGEGSKKKLLEYGIRADFMPEKFTGKHLAEQILKRLDKDDRVLIIRAKESSQDIPEVFSRNNINFTDTYIYKTIIDYRRKDELLRNIASTDYIVVASPSAARAVNEFIEDKKSLENKIVSIGPVTTRYCEEIGLKVLITAKIYTMEGIRDAIVEYMHK